jgi:D-alanyl-D-alanine carboxypeptidase/D-alanyl-D-alanine carboxypeptidase (penicillin-binding protein 5/6)
MRLCLCVRKAVLALILIFSLTTISVAKESNGTAESIPVLSAKSAVLMDADTGIVLLDKDGQTEAPIASITKIMTTLLLLEAGETDKTVTVTSAMLAGVSGTAIYLKPGDTITRYGLAVAMMLESGNDAANVAAFDVAGSLPAFAQQMNERAAKIGMKNTYFVTPSGLDAEDEGGSHHSSAYDMALLCRVAIQNKAFLAVSGSRNATIEFGNPPAPHTYSNHNRLLREYEGIVSGKTGFTKSAGRTLVTVCTREGVTLIAVTLAAPNDWSDHKKLYDWGFHQYKPYNLESVFSGVTLPVVGSAEKSVALSFGAEPQVPLLKKPKKVTRKIFVKHFIYAPLPAGHVVGRAEYYDETGTLLTAVPLVTSVYVDAPPAKAA